MSRKYGAASKSQLARGVSATKPIAFMVYLEGHTRTRHPYRYPHHNEEEGIRDKGKLRDPLPMRALLAPTPIPTTAQAQATPATPAIPATTTTTTVVTAITTVRTMSQPRTTAVGPPKR
jgi:hypothetical protein